jgi:hypothetical protein
VKDVKKKDLVAIATLKRNNPNEAIEKAGANTLNPL